MTNDTNDTRLSRRSFATLAALTVGSMVGGALSACGTANDEDRAAGRGGGGAAGGKSITIGYIDWDEDVAVTYLFKRILADKGYSVKLQHVADAGPVFIGLQKGQIDLYLDAWLPLTHKAYWDKYGTELSDLGVWYENAKLTIAVPDYMSISSLDQLGSVKSQVGGTVVGIEPGAGLTKAATEALKTYTSGAFKLQTSSTAAMLAALKKATDAKEPIVVTLWRPHWAYASFPVKDLADPKGVMGKAEKIHAVGRKGFEKDFADVAAMMKKFQLDDKLLSDLEATVLQKYKSNPEKGVAEWLKQHPDFVKSLG